MALYRHEAVSEASWNALAVHTHIALLESHSKQITSLALALCLLDVGASVIQES